MKIWERHLGFKQFISNQCKGNLHNLPPLNFSLNLSKLRKALMQWSYEIFGDVNRKEEDMKTDIERAQQDLESCWTDEKYNSLFRLRTELE